MIQVQLRPETEAQLAAEASSRGIEVGEYAGAVLEKAFRAPDKLTGPPKTQGEIDAWLDSLAQFSGKITPMQGQTFAREWLYQDHD